MKRFVVEVEVLGRRQIRLVPAKDENTARRNCTTEESKVIYGYEGVRQKGSHKQYLNKETGDLTTIKQESPLKKAYIVDILNRIGE